MDSARHHVKLWLWVSGMIVEADVIQEKVKCHIFIHIMGETFSNTAADWGPLAGGNSAASLPCHHLLETSDFWLNSNIKHL